MGLHDKPVVLGNMDEYWTPMLGLINNMIKVGYTPERHLDLFDTANNVDEIMEYINSYDIEGNVQADVRKM